MIKKKNEKIRFINMRADLESNVRETYIINKQKVIIECC